MRGFDYARLFYNINTQTGLKFHGEFILVDGDLFNQPADKGLVVFLDGGGLFPQENAHVGDALLDLVTVCAFHQGFLFFVPQAVNLIAHLLIIRVGRGQLQKLRLQFLQAFFDVSEYLVVPVAEDGFDIFLQNFKEIILIAERPVDGFDQHLLQPALRHGAGVAVQAGVLQPADAPPDNRFFAPVVPVNSAVKLPAAAAVDDVRQTVTAAEHPLFPVRAFMNQLPAHQFLLHLHENLPRDNGFMAVFHVILRNDSLVFDSRFREKIRGVGFLQKGVADVFFVSQNLADVAGVPVCVARAV